MNIEKCSELHIDDDNIYKKLENKYKEFFENYLLQCVDLKKYDDMIKNSDLDFGIYENDIEIKSNLNEYMNLNYICILNNFYIEKLSLDEISLLNTSSNNEIMDLIKKTYKEIIKNNYYLGKYHDKVYKVNYSNFSSIKYMNDNNSLVLLIYYGKNKNIYTKESYIENFRNKKEFLNNISSLIKNDLENALDIPVSVIYQKM